jgi:hypothetical protein
MSFLISVVIGLVIIGLILWLVGMLPIDAKIKQIINVIVVVFIVIWLITMLLPLVGYHGLALH